MPDIVGKLGEFLASRIVGLDGSSCIFMGRVSHVFPDLNFISNAVVKNAPYLSIPIASGVYKSSYLLVNKNNIRTISEVIHSGTSAAGADISGAHRGNNNFLLEIISGGFRGQAIFRLSSDGGISWGENQSVPHNGQIEIGDGTILTLGAQEELIEGETYAWQTVSMQERIYQTDDLMLRLALNFYAASEVELFGNADFEGYFQQAVNIIKENRAISDGEHIWKLSLDAEAQPISDQRADKYRVVIGTILEGSLYYKKRVPLISLVDEEISNA